MKLDTADIARIATAVGVILVAGAVLAVGLLRPTPVEKTAAETAPEVAVRAAELEIDLTNKFPDQDKARLLEMHTAGETTAFADLEFRNGVYTDPATGGLFSGYLVDAFESGAPRVLAAAIDGRLEGPAVILYDTGVVHFSISFASGREVGQMLEFYPDGAMKLRVMLGEDSPNGGTRVAEVTVDRYEIAGERDRSEYRSGRLQFFRPDGSTDRTNQTVPLERWEGYMLFVDRIVGGQSVYTSDSRTITLPDA